MRVRQIQGAVAAVLIGVLAGLAAVGAGLVWFAAVVLGGIVAVVIAALAVVVLELRRSGRASSRTAGAQARIDRRLARVLRAVEPRGGRSPFPALVELPSRLPRWPADLRGHRDRLALGITGVDQLRRCAALSAGLVQVSELVVELRDWAPPTPDWSGRVGPLAGLREHDVRWDIEGRGLHVRLRTGRPVDLSRSLRAILAAAQPQRARPSACSPDVALGVPVPRSAESLLSWGAEVILPDEHEDEHVRRTDLLVVDETVSAPAIDTGQRLVVAESPWATVADGSGERLVVVDPTVCRPVGRRGFSGAPTRLVVRDGGLLLVDGDGAVHAQLRSAPFDSSEVRDLLGVGSCVVDGALCGAATVAALVQLSACGVIVTVEPGGDGVPGVAPPLRELWAAPLPAAGDDLGRLASSVAQRRAALRSHSLLAARVQAAPAVSVLLVTKRPDNLAGVLAQLDASTYPELQVVVGVHGHPQDEPAVRDAIAATGLANVVLLFTPGAQSFGTALGSATARAEGDLVAKIDDDDVYGPEHLWDLVLAREYSGAQLVGKPPLFTYVEALDRTIWRSGGIVEGYGTYVAGGTILLAKADLEAVGGWRPVRRSVDRALLQRVLGAGGLVYSTHELGYLYVRHESGHTWDAGLDYFRDAPRRRDWPGRLPHPELGTVAAGPAAGTPA